MRGRRESRLALGLAVVLALSLSASMARARGAGPQKQADSLRRQQSGLSAKTQSALLGLYALDSRLAQARSELASVRARAEALRGEELRVREELAIVSQSLRVSQRVLAGHLRTLYEEGEPDGIAVLLGSSSLDDAVTRLNELEQGARQGAVAVTETQQGHSRLTRLADELAARAREAQALEARAKQTTAALSSARAARVAYLGALARQRRLNTREIASLEGRARRVIERAQAVQARSVPTSATASAPVSVGPRTLTVTATGYSLPGHTSTGLPVGPGVVAVDPSVIPLGTRLTVPGYGEAIAADTGSAVSGYTIDLWFPTLGDALAWGRRTVTITLH